MMKFEIVSILALGLGLSTPSLAQQATPAPEVHSMAGGGLAGVYANGAGTTAGSPRAGGLGF